MKYCRKCDRRRNETAFSKDRKRKDGLYPYCKECQATYAAAWRRKNHKRELAKSRKRYSLPSVRKAKRDSHLRRAYGIDLDEYHKLRKRQKGKCLICQSYFGNKLVVDHDHNTGIVRGLLCSGCNSGIRLFEAGQCVVARILAYLEIAA